MQLIRVIVASACILVYAVRILALRPVCISEAQLRPLQNMTTLSRRQMIRPQIPDSQLDWCIGPFVRGRCDIWAESPMNHSRLGFVWAFLWWISDVFEYVIGSNRVVRGHFLSEMSIRLRWESNQPFFYYSKFLDHFIGPFRYRSSDIWIIHGLYEHLHFELVWGYGRTSQTNERLAPYDAESLKLLDKKLRDHLRYASRVSVKVLRLDSSVDADA